MGRCIVTASFAGMLTLVQDRIQTATRQKAQRGVFTRLTHPDHIDVESHLKSRGLSWCLERFEVPYPQADSLADLDSMNINFATLFPDLNGAARQANIRPFIYGMAGVEISVTPNSDGTLLLSVPEVSPD